LEVVKEGSGEGVENIKYAREGIENVTSSHTVIHCNHCSHCNTLQHTATFRKLYREELERASRT